MNHPERDSNTELPNESTLFTVNTASDHASASQSHNQIALNEALRITRVLHESGFIAYLAGGCVRDALLRRTPKDFDVATNATPESVREVFGKRNTLAFGAQFGVIGVLPPYDNRRDTHRSAVTPTEVATFRSDGDYSDGRRPDSVIFGDAKQDALRRDFRINGMFYDPHTDRIIDFVGGKDDLRDQRLRTIGRPWDRFDEDKLRMLRAVRFATVLGFEIDPETVEAIVQHADQIKVVSGERIGAEMRKVLASPNAVAGLKKLQSCALTPHVLPEANDADLNSIQRLVQSLDRTDFESVLSLILIGRDASIGDLKQVAKRWKLSGEEVRMCSAAIKHWKTIAGADARQPWSVVQPVLIDRDANLIVRVATALVAARKIDPSAITVATDALAWSAEKLNPAPLLTGNDLADMGIQRGPIFAKVLKELRAQQLDGKVHSRNEAEKLARTLANA